MSEQNMDTFENNKSNFEKGLYTMFEVEEEPDGSGIRILDIKEDVAEKYGDQQIAQFKELIRKIEEYFNSGMCVEDYFAWGADIINRISNNKDQ